MFFILKLQDHRVEFSKWWTTEYKTVKFPAQGTIFDYYIDSESKKFEPWTKLVPKFSLDTDLPLQVIFKLNKKLHIYFIFIYFFLISVCSCKYI